MVYSEHWKSAGMFNVAHSAFVLKCVISRPRDLLQRPRDQSSPKAGCHRLHFVLQAPRSAMKHPENYLGTHPGDELVTGANFIGIGWSL